MNNDVVIIDLDRPRQLKFGHTALKTLVELTGMSIEDFDQSGIDPADFETVEKLMYCGLLLDAKGNGEALTLEQIPDLLDKAPTFVHVIEKLVQSWNMAFGAVPAGNPPAPAERPAKGNRSTGMKASE